MSQKNHEITDGRLVQTDKKYSHLKLRQKEKIAEWMFQETRDFYTKKYTFPNDKQLSEVVDKVYEKIEEAGIWVPYGEVLKHYKSKRSNVNKRVKRLPESVKFILFCNQLSKQNWLSIALIAVFFQFPH